MSEISTNKTEFNCILKIDDFPIEVPNIKYLNIKEWCLLDSYIPRLELIVLDDGDLTEWLGVKLGSKIDVELSESQFSESIVSSFKVLDTKIIDEDGDIMSIHISAILFMNDEFMRIREVFNDNSKNIVSQITDQILPNNDFISDVVTNDKMNWIEYTYPLNFISKVINKSFISENDIVMFFISSNYQSFFVSLKNKLNSSPKYNFIEDDELFSLNDTTNLKNKLSVKNYVGENATEGDKDTFIDENVFFNGTDVNNYIGTNAFINGFSNEYNTYDITKKEFSSNINDENLDSTDGNFYDDFFSITNYSNHIKNPNTHENYDISEDIRDHYLSQLFSQSYLIVTNSFNELNLLDTIEIIKPSKNVVTSQKDSNNILSGKYIVGAINYVVTGGDNKQFMRLINIFRVGLNESDV